MHWFQSKPLVLDLLLRELCDFGQGNLSKALFSSHTEWEEKNVKGGSGQDDGEGKSCAHFFP